MVQNLSKPKFDCIFSLKKNTSIYFYTSLLYIFPTISYRMPPFHKIHIFEGVHCDCKLFVQSACINKVMVTDLPTPGCCETGLSNHLGAPTIRELTGRVLIHVLRRFGYMDWNEHR